MIAMNVAQLLLGLQGTVRRYDFDGFRIDFPASREQFVKNLNAAFPDEHAAIAKYLERVKTVGAES